MVEHGIEQECSEGEMSRQPTASRSGNGDDWLDGPAVPPCDYLARSLTRNSAEGVERIQGHHASQREEILSFRSLHSFSNRGFEGGGSQSLRQIKGTKEIGVQADLESE